MPKRISIMMRTFSATGSMFHETRERKNDYGPCTEDDTTLIGTIELTWTASAYAGPGFQGRTERSINQGMPAVHWSLEEANHK